MKRTGHEPGIEIGLCATCAWSSRVESARGSVFIRCDRSDADPRFRRYPPLPLRACPGHETERTPGGAS